MTILVVAEHDIQPVLLRMPPQAHRLVRRVLPVVIEVHDVRPARVAPTGEHGVVLAEIPRVLDQRDRNLGIAHQRARHRTRRLAAAVVHEHDLVPALDHQRLNRAHHAADGFCAVIERDDETECDRRHEVGPPTTLRTRTNFRDPKK